LPDEASLKSGSNMGSQEGRAERVGGARRLRPAFAASQRNVQLPNAFSRPMRSIASQFGPQRISLSTERHPRYLGYVIESGTQAQASHDKTQRILKGTLR
jgi:hypothetical protein